MIVGGWVYPAPAFVRKMLVTLPARPTLAIPVAVQAVYPIPVPIPPGSLNVTFGGLAGLYPAPPSVIVIIPTVPGAILAYASAPFPPPPCRSTEGASEYPHPAFVSRRS